MDQITTSPACHLDRFSEDADTSFTLPARMYFASDTLSDERSKIFLKSWIYVAHVSDLAESGAYVTTEITDQRIFVIRNSDGDLRAFFNVCQHRGHSLLRGKGTSRNLIVCPYHAWSYDRDGALQAAPNCAHVKDFVKAEFALPEVRVEVFAGFVFVNLDPNAKPMGEVYPGAEERLRTFCANPEDLISSPEVAFHIKGNWKNVGDNLLECYHCSTAHKAFVDMVDMSTYQVELHNAWSIQWGQCRPENLAYNFDATSPCQSNFTLYLWPVLAFAQFPGTTGLATFSFLPLEPELTHQSFTYHSPSSDLNATETKALDYFRDVLGPEDVSLVEDVQRGLHSLGYHQGRFMIDGARSQVSEHAIHHFQSLVAGSLGDL